MINFFFVSLYLAVLHRVWEVLLVAVLFIGVEEIVPLLGEIVTFTYGCIT